MNNRREKLDTICTNVVSIILILAAFALMYYLGSTDSEDSQPNTELCVELASTMPYTPMFMDAIEDMFPLEDNANKPSVIKEETSEDRVSQEECKQDVINIPLSAKISEETKPEIMVKPTPSPTPKPVETPVPTPAVEQEQPVVEEDIEEPQAPAYIVTEDDIVACAKMLYGEARGCSLADKQNCVRTVCNRCSDSRWPSTIYGCVTQRSQYYGYSSSNPVTDELYGIAKQVIYDWVAMLGGADVAWNSYNCFSGNGSYNSFYTI